MAQTVATKRTKRGTFEKGVSGNPGGKSSAGIELTRAARALGMEGLEAITAIARMHMDAEVRMAAWGMILDRGFGRPRQQVDIAGDIEHRFVIRAPEVADDASEWEAKWGGPLIEGVAESDED